MTSAEAVIALALQQRPVLLALKLTHDADLHFARAHTIGSSPPSPA
jgi:hypothetical protein